MFCNVLGTLNLVNIAPDSLGIDPPLVIWSLATVSSAASASALWSLLRPLLIYSLCVFITYH